MNGAGFIQNAFPTYVPLVWISGRSVPEYRHWRGQSPLRNSGVDGAVSLSSWE